MPASDQSPKSFPLPRLQAYLLIGILIVYPALAIVLNKVNAPDPSKITSRIQQIYLPAILLQAILLSAIYYVLKRTGASLAEIGLGREDINWSNALSGVIFFVGAWTFILIAKAAIERSGYLAGKDFLYVLPQTPPERIFWLALSLGAALSEEICFRGFAISRLKIVSGSYWAGALLSSAAFSMGHLYQGLSGVALIFVYGLLFSGLFVARLSVFPCIVAHFLQDALVLFAL